MDALLNTSPILERFRLHGRVALVTGGGQGIGRAFAHALGEAGAAVAVVDLVRARAEGVAHELAAKGIDSIAISVNNAGIGQWTDAEAVSPADWQRMLDVNLTGVFLCAQAAGRALLTAGYGKIINTASMSGSIVNTPQNQAAYNTSKAGVIHLTRSLAAEWAGRGVRVNSISPGYTRTQLVEDLVQTPTGQAIMPRWLALTPLGRMGEVTDLQGAVVYLAAPASDFMTGHDLVVDGGYSVW
jgi:NAD(P)-dependent dehydrogenase (short-subunit alcohol dehydrogenase family)